MKPQKFKHISRAIDGYGVHYLDAIDECVMSQIYEYFQFSDTDG